MFSQTANVRRVLAIALAVAGLSCGAGDTVAPPPPPPPVTPPPPPPPAPEVVTVSLTVRDTVQSVTSFPMVTLPITASAVSSKGYPVIVTCTVGNSTPCASARGDSGVHNVRVIAVSTSPEAISVKDSATLRVVPLLKLQQIRGFDANGIEYIPVGMPVVLGDTLPGTPRDTSRVGADGLLKIYSRYVNMGNVPAHYLGDAVLKPSFGRTSSEFWASPAVVMGSRGINTPACATTGPSVAITIDLDREAYVRGPANVAPQDIPLYLRVQLQDNSSWVYHDGSQASFPTKVAFDSVITMSDSIRFWVQADSVNRAFCQERIRPGMLAEVQSQGGVQVHFSPNTASATIGGLPRDYIFSSITIDTVAVWSNFYGGYALWHEFGHSVAGVGHECNFESNMAYGCNAFSHGITKKDVGYMRWKELLVALERKYSTRIALAWVHQGERRERGLPEESVVWVTAEGGLGTVSNPAGPMVSLSLAALLAPAVREPPKNLFPRMIIERFPRLK